MPRWNPCVHTAEQAGSLESKQTNKLLLGKLGTYGKKRKKMGVGATARKEVESVVCRNNKQTLIDSGEQWQQRTKV